jgi:hypothetical protein
LENELANLIDPFHRALHSRLSEDIANRTHALVTGAAASHDEYRYQVGYLEALNRVLEACQELENERYGENRKVS